VVFLFPCTNSAEKKKTRTEDINVFVFFFVSVVVAQKDNRKLTQNHSYHTFLDHSQSTRTWTSRFDYLGIVIPLWGTTIASTHFGFRCESDLRKAYSVFATGAGLACAATTLHPSFVGTASKGFRAVTYLLLGLSSFLPIVHGLHLFGWQQMEQRMSLSYYLALGLCHGTGAITYASRIPERWYPKRYDIVGSSHQIMHVLVVCGAVAYGIGVLRAREHWRGQGCASL
jgi:adiponectin receptor